MPRSNNYSNLDNANIYLADMLCPTTYGKCIEISYMLYVTLNYKACYVKGPKTCIELYIQSPSSSTTSYLEPPSNWNPVVHDSVELKLVDLDHSGYTSQESLEATPDSILLSNYKS
jgi:hypothetical protein